MHRKYYISAVISAFLVLGCGLPSVFAEQQLAGEYQVKAAFLYNFINFVEWPLHSSFENSNTVTMCIIGDHPFGDALNELKSETVRGKKLSIEYRYFNNLRGCHILFIPVSEKSHVANIIRSVANSGVLTISDTEESVRQGIIIGFFVEQKKVRFAVNIDASRRAGLKISAKLLKLAKIVSVTEGNDSTE